MAYTCDQSPTWSLSSNEVIIITSNCLGKKIKPFFLSFGLHPDQKQSYESSIFTTKKKTRVLMATNLECPLCLDTFTAACETSCGHAFCAPCILQVWEVGSRQGKIKCPIDRRMVSMLIPSWTLRAEVDIRDHEKGIKSTKEYDIQIEDYNQKNSLKPRNFSDQAQEDWILLRKMFAERKIIYKVLIFVTMFVGFLYFVAPADLIPDSYGLIGYLDDVCVVLLCFWAIILLLEWYRKKLLSSIHS
eukprot:TRINITY_DN1971_c0_g1_i4.p1 TRINITY_DN1971_c0_g1~~TRINITY_DN1971_c0_g1_i4.p1  ORF type:complete len:245 (-),score=4.93 TRINITY_DN1971_c0_g1_i4:34-768(-)